MSEHTPMFQQYWHIKHQHPDALLFYRMGDFYELFYDDAIQAAPMLNITLTQRGQSADKPVPMAGIPVHSPEPYWSKLLQQGLTLAICEQVETAEPHKGLLPREVVKILTPGTVLDPALLPDHLPQYLMALEPRRTPWGLALLDLASGECRIKHITPDQWQDEWTRYQPKELLVPERWEPSPDHKRHMQSTLITRPPWMFTVSQAESLIAQHLHADPLALSASQHLPQAASALAALLDYASHMSQHALEHIRPVVIDTDRDTLHLDTHTQRHLALVHNAQGGTSHTLLSVLDTTHTPMGKRLLRNWLLHPTRQLQVRCSRWQAIGHLKHRARHTHLAPHLTGMCDVPRLLARMQMGTITPNELNAIKHSLTAWRMMRDDPQAAEALNMVWPAARQLDPTAWIERIGSWVRDPLPPGHTWGERIQDGVDPELDRLRSHHHNDHTQMVAYERQQRQQLRAPQLKLIHHRMHGHVLDIPKGQLKKIALPDDYILLQSLKNSERFTTPALQQLEASRRQASEHTLQREQALYQSLLSELQDTLDPYLAWADRIAELDVLNTLAERADTLGWCCPHTTDTPCVHIEGGWHPVIAAQPGMAFTPNDTHLAPTQPVHVITGPNMGGKSTHMRQVALIVILAAMGSFVPARQARLGDVDRIFTRIGASDDLAGNRSTFMVEMTETADILRHASSHSLVLLDEIGRGTDTREGLALAKAIAITLAEQHTLTLFATHYHDLAHWAQQQDGMENWHVRAEEINQQLVFSHTLHPGPGPGSFGLAVARAAGIPASVLERAQAFIET